MSKLDGLIRKTIVFLQVHRINCKHQPKGESEEKVLQPTLFLVVSMLFLVVISTPTDINKRHDRIGYWLLAGNAKDESGNGCHGELTQKCQMGGQG